MNKEKKSKTFTWRIRPLIQPKEHQAFLAYNYNIGWCIEEAKVILNSNWTDVYSWEEIDMWFKKNVAQVS